MPIYLNQYFKTQTKI